MLLQLFEIWSLQKMKSIHVLRNFWARKKQNKKKWNNLFFELFKVAKKNGIHAFEVFLSSQKKLIRDLEDFQAYKNMFFELSKNPCFLSFLKLGKIDFMFFGVFRLKKVESMYLQVFKGYKKLNPCFWTFLKLNPCFLNFSSLQKM